MDSFSSSLLAAVFLLVALCAPKPGARALRFVEHFAGRVARRPGWAIVWVGLFAFGAGAALSIFGTLPQPSVHDEFCHLLAGDTFAHGRVSNPAHPLWVHFETMHIIQQPTYASKYPPGQGLFLAVGQVLTGYPIVGVWLSTGLAGAALCWMLMAWVRPRWALLGGLLWALNPTTLTWSQRYWGGAVAVAGGALVLGAVRRLAERPRVRDSLLLGLGMAILANSRPFEGLVLCLLTVTGLLPMRRKDRELRAVLSRIVLPVALVVAGTLAMMGYYNWRVTGNPWRLPHTVHQEAYTVVSPFLWQSTRPEPSYRHRELRDFYVKWEQSAYKRQGSAKELLQGAWEKLAALRRGYLNLPAFFLALAGIPWVLTNRWMRWLFLIGLEFVLVLLLSETWIQWHYAAPAAGLVLILFVQGIRQVRLWQWRGKPTGRFLVPAALVLSLLTAVEASVDISREKRTEWGMTRARFVEQLVRQGGKHLVIVRYQPGHNVHAEWVYNAADIDHAPVVWAREMAPEENRELLRYFKDRQAWLLEADEAAPELVPYPSGSAASPGSGLR
jgi:hypothetical protein